MVYTRVAFKGISWISLLRISTRIVTFIRLAVLGRLLTPTQFGLFGIGSLILSLFEILTETGINVFLVQAKDNIKVYLDAAWAVSIIRGIVLFLIISLFSSIISRFFNSPDAYTIIVLISIVPLIRGFINPAIIIYQKDLLFHNEFKLRFVLFLIDVVVSIIFGFVTKNAIAFIYGLIASATVEVLLSYTLIPLWPSIRFEYKKIKHVINKSWWVTLTGIFSYFADNGDNITVGKILGSASLGIYQISYKFSTLPISEITNVVNQVVFPVYSKFSADKDRLLKAFLRVTALSSLGAIILGGIIFVFAKPLIFVLMGTQWVSAVPAIRILAVYGILRTIFGNFAPLFLAISKQDYVAQMTFFRLIGLALFVIPLVSFYGMVGAGYAMLLSIFLEIPIILYFFLKTFKKI